MTATVRDVMSPTPVTVRPEATAGEVAQLMRDEDIGAVLVAEGGDLRGLITDRDLVVRMLAMGAGPQDPASLACSKQLFYVTPQTEVAQAAEVMRSAAVRRLPVLENDKPVGIVSLGDLAAMGSPESVLGGISSAMPNT